MNSLRNDPRYGRNHTLTYLPKNGIYLQHLLLSGTSLLRLSEICGIYSLNYRNELSLLVFVFLASTSKTYIGSVLFRASAFTGAKFSKRSTSGYRTFRALVEYSSVLLN